METAEDREKLIHTMIEKTIHVGRLHHRVVENRIDGMGVHHSQHRLLMQLAHAEKIPSQKELSEDMNVSPACIARMLKALETSGYIHREEAAHDSRCNEIAITPDGQQAIRSTLTLFKRIDQEMYEGIPTEDIRTACNVFSMVLNNLSNMELPERSV